MSVDLQRPAGTGPGGGAVEVVRVPWEDADAVALRAEAVAELGRRYGGDDDAHEVIDPGTVVATFLVRVDGVPAACGSVRDVSATDDGRGRGTVHPAATGELKRVFVLPEHRGRGLARLLMAELERVARQAGFRRFVLETGTAQPEAIGLYTALGYEPIESYGKYAGYDDQRSFGKHL
ncbi:MULTISPECIES: GNAT family N-acetyltransferase [unclassified Isoptericola]|uniref:GNAT family N-acetyltransferase n=1 Tax=unclassified Isoptericola TaxID=2623355 RepID=UPI002713B374|nr:MULTISPECIES: GNAT family N-acetyltransferase [unclassified Isoptericola]MDO8143457.1 GNAT family N-acetyltransferase [Isoptericola sp. 178]MDO8147318.1 GNAT family N-acetyltransferase [Isoptericola sp. b515]